MLVAGFAHRLLLQAMMSRGFVDEAEGTTMWERCREAGLARAELDGGEFATASFPDPKDLMNFQVNVKANEGYWSGHEYAFSFTIPDLYPHDPPKVRCLDKIYHPNIDLEGNVCLNVLRKDWKPVLDINAVIYGLLVLFNEPNPNDPLNHAAAELMRDDPAQFERNVAKSLKGNTVDSEPFPPAKRWR